MIKTLRLFPLLLVCVLTTGAAVKPRPEILGVSLGMMRDDARARLRSLGTLEREERKRQEVWAVKDARVSHLLVGYDAELRVRYVTALARANGPRIRYQDVGDVKSAHRTDTHGNLKFTWEVPARHGRFAYLIIARGRDSQYLESYSVKKVDAEEEEIDE